MSLGVWLTLEDFAMNRWELKRGKTFYLNLLISTPDLPAYKFICASIRIAT